MMSQSFQNAAHICVSRFTVTVTNSKTYCAPKPFGLGASTAPLTPLVGGVVAVVAGVAVVGVAVVVVHLF